MLPRARIVAAVAGGALLVVVAVAAAGVNLPGPPVKEVLGLSDGEFDYPPCEVGMYRLTPESPPPRTDAAWRLEERAPGGPAEGSAAAVGPMIYTFNGSGPYHLRTLYAFDTRTGEWSAPTKTPEPLNHHWAVAYKGDVYLAGGLLGGEEPTNRVWRYDPRANRFSELPKMHQPRGATGAAVIGDKLYVVGGGPNAFPAGYVESYATLEIYDFETGEWSFGPDMPGGGRHHVGTAALDGKLYVLGGRNETRLTLDIFERYDPATGRWEELAPMPLAQSSAAVVAAGGKIVAVGGEDETDWDKGKGWVTGSAWAYDPDVDRWQRLPELNVERRAHGAAVTGGRVYALMGSYCPGLTARGPRGTRTVESLPVEYVRDL